MTFNEKLEKAEKAAAAAWRRSEEAAQAASVIGSLASQARARRAYLTAERLGEAAATLRAQARAWESQDKMRTHQHELEADFWA
jgi:hypothetical protein